MSVDISRLSEGLPAKQQKAVRQEYRQRAKNPTTAFLLCFFLGIFGLHCFYLGKTVQGVFRLVISPLVIPGLIWEIFDLFRIDHEVYERNLKVAEQVVAAAMLSVPNAAAEREAIAELDGLVRAQQGAAASASAPTASAPPAQPEAAAPAPAVEAPAPPARDEAPPVWPVPAALAAEAVLGSAPAKPETEWAATDMQSAAVQPAPPAGDATVDAPAAAFAPAADAPAEPAVSAPSWAPPARLAMESEPLAVPLDTPPPMWAPAAPASALEELPPAVWVPPVPPEPAPAPWFEPSEPAKPAAAETPPSAWEPAAPAGLVWASASQPEWTSADMADLDAGDESLDHWTDITAEMVAQAAQAADEEAPLGAAAPLAASVAHEGAMAYVAGAGPAAAPAGDVTDRGTDVGDPGQLADVGEGAWGRVRVTLPGDPTPQPQAAAGDTAAPASVERPAGGEDNPLLVLIPDEPHTPAPYGDTATATFGGLAAALGTGAVLASAESAPEREPAQLTPLPLAESAAAEPASMPAAGSYETHVAEEEHDHPAGGARRVVKRVRVVRRLVVNGQVVQEASAEQVVDADADTAATAASLQQTLGTTDSETLAALAAQAGLQLDGEPTPPAQGAPTPGTGGAGGASSPGA
jgi:TM2 domain-containing membrane protein YozV